MFLAGEIRVNVSGVDNIPSEITITDDLYPEGLIEKVSRGRQAF